MNGEWILIHWTANYSSRSRYQMLSRNMIYKLLNPCFSLLRLCFFYQMTLVYSPMIMAHNLIYSHTLITRSCGKNIFKIKTIWCANEIRILGNSGLYNLPPKQGWEFKIPIKRNFKSAAGLQLRKSEHKLFSW